MGINQSAENPTSPGLPPSQVVRGPDRLVAPEQTPLQRVRTVLNELDTLNNGINFQTGRFANGEITRQQLTDAEAQDRIAREQWEARYQETISHLPEAQALVQIKAEEYTKAKQRLDAGGFRDRTQHAYAKVDEEIARTEFDEAQKNLATVQGQTAPPQDTGIKTTP